MRCHARPRPAKAWHCTSRGTRARASSGFTVTRSTRRSGAGCGSSFRDGATLGVNLAGHGQSRGLESGDTLAGVARTVIRIARHHDLRHLVGVSFGGMVALEAAIEAPASFASLALGSPAVAGGPTDSDAGTRNRELARLYRERGVGRWLAELWMRSPPDISQRRRPPHGSMEHAGRSRRATSLGGARDGPDGTAHDAVAAATPRLDRVSDVVADRRRRHADVQANRAAHPACRRRMRACLRAFGGAPGTSGGAGRGGAAPERALAPRGSVRGAAREQLTPARRTRG